MTKAQLQDFYDRYRAGQLSKAELADFYTALQDPAMQDFVNDVLNSDWYVMQNEQLQDVRPEKADAIFKQITKKRPIRNLWYWSAAACLLVGITVGYVLLQKRPVQNTQQTAQQILPGGNKAYITLANGKKVNVTDAKTGLLAKQGTVNIIKAASGKVQYVAVQQQSDLTKVYNTVSTPVSGQHSVILPDGTLVMLDAESSITFPVQFPKNKREVKITGHAWFAVRYKAQQPFSVLAGNTRVNDLGTQFDLNAYPDEQAVTTTLVEGSVAVNNKKIVPGQQALVHDNNIIVQAADTSAIIAWKDGNFIFRNQDLKVTMRQLARWYGITVVYHDAPEHLHIGGNISRSRNLSVVLAAMEQTGEVHFKLNGRVLTVTQ